MRTLPDILRMHLQERPDFPVLRFLSKEECDTVTYEGLLAGSAAYAIALKEAGIRPGEPVVIILKHGQQLVYAFFGAMLNGSIPSIMPYLTEKLSPERYRESLRSLISITEPAAMITYPDFSNEVSAATDDRDSVRAVLLSSEVEIGDGFAGLTLKDFNARPEDIVLLQHSSGTTGLQKGVALSHHAVLNQINAYAQAMQLTAEDVVVSWLPLYHDMGLIAGFLLPILAGNELVLMSPFEWVRAPFRLMQAVSTYKGTLSWLPNFAYNFCAKKIRDRHLEGVDLSTWRAISNCSEPMRWESHQVFFERFKSYGLRYEALATCYAMAENVFAVTQGGIESGVTVDIVDRRKLQEERLAKPTEAGDHALKMLSAGKPIPGTEVRILDADRQALPERHLGEIALRSDCMLTGYYHRDDLTQQAFHEGWYLTGDLGYIADGELYVTGRQKELIIVGGKNIYPQDLEELAREVPGVHPGRVVAFGVFNESIGTEEVAIVAETDEPDEAERRNIRAAIREKVNTGSDVILRYVEVVDRQWLIKTSSGKISRKANREKYLQTYHSSS